MQTASIIFFFLSSALLSLLLTPLGARLTGNHGLMDHPGPRKVHHSPIPKTGGIAVIFSMLISVAAGFYFNFDHQSLSGEKLFRLGSILGATFLAALLGIWDDFYDLRPRTKLVFQAMLTLSFSFFCFRFTIFHLPGMAPFGLHDWGIPLTALWMMAVLNGFNFIDGIDGLAGSVSIVSLLGLASAAVLLQGTIPLGAALSLLGALFVFLFFNWRPAKVYLGDSGSNALGMFTAACLVSLDSPPAFLLQGHPPILDGHESFRFQIFTSTLLAGYPLVEIVLSTARRLTKRFYYGRSVEWSEREHIHHQFLKLGLKTSQICWIAIGFQAVLAVAGLLAVSHQNALAIWLLAPLAMAMAYFMPRLGLLDFLGENSIQQRPHFALANLFISMQRVKLRLAPAQEEVLVLVGKTCREFGVLSCRMTLKPDKENKGGVAYHREWKQEIHSEHLEFIKHGADPHKPGFSDRFKLSDGRGEALWTFESHLVEDDLEVEYRILVREFMREALETVRKLGMGRPNLEISQNAPLNHKNVRGHMLRKHQGIRRKK